MRFYAVELGEAEYGPEFPSHEEAFRWACTNIPSEDGHLSVTIAMLRDGQRVGGMAVMGWVTDERSP
jgi:hypothetical protein